MALTRAKSRDLARRDHLMTTSEAAVLLGKSKRTLERWIRSGQVSPPAKAANGYYYWPVAELHRLKHEHGSQDEGGR